ncbi:MAG: ribosomal protein L7/L12 [Clostridia bacterium]|nr:ribosomal protein L7/L12 [Clostridia bacterium]
MALKQIRCPRCGGELIKTGDTYKCSSCNATFYEDTVSQNEKIIEQFLDELKLEKVSALRQRLWEQVNAQYLSSTEIADIAKKIRSYLPEDFLARFYETVCSKNKKEINKFISEIDYEKEYYNLDLVVEFMIKSLSSENLLSVNNLIEKAYKDKDIKIYHKYTSMLSTEAEKVKKGIYETRIPRDVFVAYSSKDMEKVEELTDYLESKKISCFVAMRNLRHGAGAVENYDKALEEAIDNCKVFVFISSSNSRDLDCDAMVKEIPYVKRTDKENAPIKYRRNYATMPRVYKKPRIEFLIEKHGDDEPTEPIVNEFFNGYEWCYDLKDVAARIVKFKIDEEDDEEEFEENEEEVTEQETKQNNIEKVPEQTKKIPETPKREQKQAVKPVAEAKPEPKKKTTKVEPKKEEVKFVPEPKKEEAPASNYAFTLKLVEINTSKLEVIRIIQDVTDCGMLDAKRMTDILPSVVMESNSILEVEKAQRKLNRIGCKTEIITNIYKQHNEEKEVKEVKKEQPVAKSTTKKETSITVNEQQPAKVVEPTVEAFTIQGKTLVKYNGKEKVIVIPESVDTIDENAFSEKAITQVTIPSSVKVISSHAFDSCKQLTSVIFNEGLEQINDFAFNDCFKLKDIKLPNTLKSIGICAFVSCKSITEIELPNNLETIHKHAFGICENLKSIKVNAKLKNVEDTFLSNCRNLESIVVDKNNKYFDSRNDCNAIINTQTNTLICGCKTTMIPESVVEIGHQAFNGSRNLTEIVIPEGVVTIKAEAFYHCSSLVKVCLPSTIKLFEEGAFKECTSLETFEYSGTSKEFAKIKKENLWNKGIVKSKLVEVPKKKVTTTKVVNSSVSQPQKEDASKKVYTTRVPDGTTTINKEQYRSSYMTRVIIPKSVKFVDEDAFIYCDSLEEVVFEGSIADWLKIEFNQSDVTSISNPLKKAKKFFTSDSAEPIENLVIPNTVKTIGKGCFDGFESLKSVVIPASIEVISEYAFENCANLESVQFKGIVKSINERAFYGCKKLKNISLKEGLVSIGRYAFAHSDLSDLVELPKSLKEMDGYAFCGSNIIKIKIYDGIERIGEKVFSYCKKLKSADIYTKNLNFVGCNAFDEDGQVVNVDRKKPLLGQPRGWDKWWTSKNVVVNWGQNLPTK